MASVFKTTNETAKIIDNRNSSSFKYRTSQSVINTSGFSSVTLSWENINVFVKSNGNGGLCPTSCRWKKREETPPKQILFNMNGIVNQGTLLAIMGGSGSGKSTLLNVLNARRLGALTVSGDVRVNGVKFNGNMASISGYVQQDDLFITCLTLKEHLWFQAMLRMDKQLTKQSRICRIDEVTNEFGLTSCCETIIGALSGGEKKRLAFACEVLTNPALLFCDEPTSGLDSAMAENIVQTLKSLATNNNRTVLFTIHQPSSQVYALFDRVLLLAKGQVAYLGPKKEMANFFTSLDKECPVDFNPADFYIHTLAVTAGREKECDHEIQKVCDAYATSKLSKEMNSEIYEVRVRNSGEIQADKEQLSPYKASCCEHFRTLLWRSWTMNVRNPSLTTVKFVQTLVVALMIGLFYLHQPYDQKGIQNINGAIFIQQVHMSQWPFHSVLHVFPLEFPMLLREHHNGMYSVWMYFICKTIAALPYWIVFPIIYSTIAYWMIGLYSSVESYLIATITLLLTANVAAAYGYLVSSCSSTVAIATSIGQMFSIPLMLFGGFFINSLSLPIYFVWMKYLVWYTYSNEILVVNQWRHVTNLTCKDENRLNEVDTVDEQSICFVNGDEVLNSLGFHEDNMKFDLVMLILLSITFRLLSFVALHIRSRKRE